MANTASKSVASDVKSTVDTLKGQGKVAVLIGLSAATAVFAVQAAVTAGKTLTSDVKAVVSTLKG